MRKLNQYLFLFSLFLLSACAKENMGDCFKSTGDIVEETRQVPSFNYIELYDHINLYISFGTEQQVVVKGGENLQEHIETKVEGGVLVIQNNNRCNWVRSFKKNIDIYLTIPDLKGMEYRGSGEVRFLDTLVGESFVINLFQSSGDLFLLLNTPYAELKTNSGPVTITASGKVDYLVAFVGGTGFVDASGIESIGGLAVTTSTGYIRINASDFLKADISGIGDIEYFGDPTIELIDNGKGSLIKR